MAGGEKTEAKAPTEEGSAWVPYVLAVISSRYRPTVVTLVALGAFFAGAFWLDARAQGYIRDAARSSIEPVELRTTAAEKLLDSQDVRLRAIEANLAEMKADVRSVKDDVHELRRSEERHR